MTRDDIIRMAQEAGYGPTTADIHSEVLERFAALVAAAALKEEYKKINNEEGRDGRDNPFSAVRWGRR